MEALISVIVPIYNVEKYLDKCVSTIINQTYKNTEILLVDDGSTDRCPQMCDEYAKLDSRIRVIHKKNGGLSDARNAGIEQAKGEYFIFIDSDDYVSERFIEVLYNVCEDNNCEIAQCTSLSVPDDTPAAAEAEHNISFLSGYDMIKRIYQDCTSDTIVIWSKIYRRELFDGIRFPVGKLHEDEFTDYKLFDKCNKIALVSDILYFYRENPQSIVRSKYNLRRLDIFDALDERIDYLSEKGYDELVSLTKAAYVKQLLLHLNLLKTIDDAQDIYNKFSSDLKRMYPEVMNDKNVHSGYKWMLREMRHMSWIEKIKLVLKKKKL